jgi:hypothetical protein
MPIHGRSIAPFDALISIYNGIKPYHIFRMCPQRSRVSPHVLDHQHGASKLTRIAQRQTSSRTPSAGFKWLNNLGYLSPDEGLENGLY